jgi:hypothetical protein
MLDFHLEKEIRAAHDSYTKGMACAICQTRRPRRFCPGVRGDICSICCGTEREVTVTCPFECEHLQEARRHDKPVPIDASTIPNRDINVTERFVEEHEELLTFIGNVVVGSALETPGAVDYDVREALDGLIRTYRTLASGVYYETVPPNPLAANVYRAAQNAVAAFRQREQQELGMSRTRDADILGVLVFLQRIELDRNNGRQRGRAFLDSLHAFYSERGGSPPPEASSLILP